MPQYFSFILQSYCQQDNQSCFDLAQTELSNMAILLSRHRQVSVYLLTFLRPSDGQRCIQKPFPARPSPRQLSGLHQPTELLLAFTFVSLLRDAGIEDSQEAADDFRVETQHLTRLDERKLAALEELKQSLLHQAFNGEL